MESLKGHFLIATPKMPDPRFAERVIYICAHNEEGAMGLIINEPLVNLSLADILAGADLPIPQKPLPSLYLGGPVETSSFFFLCSSEYEPQTYLDVSNTVRLSRDPEILKTLSRDEGPEYVIPALGYSGWAPGQLENELATNGWLTFPAEDEVIFNTPDSQKWKMAAKRYGIDISLFDDVAGRA